MVTIFKLHHLKRFARAQWGRARRHWRIVVPVSATLFVVMVGGVVFAMQSNDTTNNAPQQTPAANTTATQKKNLPSAEQAKTNPESSSETQKTTTNTSTPKPGASTASKSLIISPTSFTVKAGEDLNLTIKSSTGAAIHMPMFDGSSATRKFIMNMPAGPAKPTWSGRIGVFSTTPTGTYTIDLFAQDTSQAFYRGSITVKIVVADYTISATNLGYDDEDDSINYRLTVNRMYGFSEPIVGYTAHSKTEPSLHCEYYVSGESTVEVACYHNPYEGDRPTNGTIYFGITTPSYSRTTTASYSFPPL